MLNIQVSFIWFLRGEVVLNSKIITVWGPNGGGKTSVAVSLGVSLSERNVMVGIVSSKLYYGELQGVFGKRLEQDKGIYKAITNGCNTKNMFESAGNGSNLFFLSVPNGFDSMLLTAISGETAKDILEDAAMRFDYLIVDGSEELNNPFSSVGLTMANNVVVVHKASTKDCLWQSSIENTVQLLNLESKIMHVLNGYDRTCDKMSYLSGVGVKFDAELPCIHNAQVLMNSGKNLYSSGGLHEYKKTIQRLVSKLM